MSCYLAFLRGINLGNRRLKMERLRGLFEAMNFSGVETFIASGNVIFDSPECDERKLAVRVEQELEKSLGYRVDTFIRTRAEVATVAAFQPFSVADLNHAGNTIHVGFFRDSLEKNLATRFFACRTEVDELRIEGRDYYWLCRIKSNESTVWTSPAMRSLKLPSSSMRNLTTIRKLAALYPDKRLA